MMVASNTSPLNYLLLIGEVRILPELFREIIPTAVRDELLAPAASDPVRQFASSLPAWVKLYSISGELNAAPTLHLGEQKTILLATQIQAELLLMDELDGRAAARNLGITVLGTLGILDLAPTANLLDFTDAWQRLRKTSFHASSQLVEQLLVRYKNRAQ
jgi:predicted nucleic acid-binding protein